VEFPCHDDEPRRRWATGHPQGRSPDSLTVGAAASSSPSASQTCAIRAGRRGDRPQHEGL